MFRPRTRRVLNSTKDHISYLQRKTVALTSHSDQNAYKMRKITLQFSSPHVDKSFKNDHIVGYAS